MDSAFKIVSSTDLDYVERTVNQLLADGWEIHGTPGYSTYNHGDESYSILCAQALVKPPVSQSESIVVEDWDDVDDIVG